MTLMKTKLTIFLSHFYPILSYFIYLICEYTSLNVEKKRKNPVWMRIWIFSEDTVILVCTAVYTQQCVLKYEYPRKYFGVNEWMIKT